MYENSQDSLLSVLCSATASLLLFGAGWTVSGFMCLMCAVYFGNKLRIPQKLKTPEDFNVCIIGAGVSGICMGKKLNDIGVNYVILEKAPTLGGTWWENIYPGVACDVPSHLYCFSFFQNPNWSREYSPGSEINEYLEQAASIFGVYPKVRFNQRVVSATWENSSGKWIIETVDGGKLMANVIVGATGGLHVPNIPTFPGKEDFKGTTFHTAQWCKDYQPEEKTIGVIGTGASAVQVVPSLAIQGVKELFVFQRTPCWSPPRYDFFYSEGIKNLFSYFPCINTLYRWFYFWRNEFRFVVVFCKSNIITQRLSDSVHNLVKLWYKTSVNDQDLVKKLIPSYNMGCKRITPSDEYIKTFNQPNVHLITDNIDMFTKEGIKAGGVEYKLDTVVFATGFDLLKTANPLNYVGLDGKVMTDVWGDTPMAYLGITHPLMPNYFALLGPGTGLGHNTIIYMIECQADYALDGIIKIIKTGAKSISLKPSVLKNYWDWMQESMKELVFADNSQVKGWYRNERGINWTLYPAGLVRYWWTTRECCLDQYHVKY